jgi:hypothetical protein
MLWEITIMTRNANVKRVIGALAQAVLDEAGPDFTGKVTITLNVHRGGVKVVAGTEEVIAATKS